MSAALAVPVMDTPAFIAEELLDALGRAITDHPRSRQTVIGPSEIGNPCPRALIHRLAGELSPSWGPGGEWLATIGTAVHAWLADAMTARNGPPVPGRQLRYLVEHRVTVGELAGQPVSGSCDLFDIDSATVVDWKVVGTSKLSSYRMQGPSAQYRTQIQLYARGLARQGHFVRTCMIAFLPRNLPLEQAYFYSAPYDEAVAVAALERAAALRALGLSLGPQAASQLYPPCQSDWCGFCATRRPYTAGRPTHRPTPGNLLGHATIGRTAP